MLFVFTSSFPSPQFLLVCCWPVLTQTWFYRFSQTTHSQASSRNLLSECSFLSSPKGAPSKGKGSGTIVAMSRGPASRVSPRRVAQCAFLCSPGDIYISGELTVWCQLFAQWCSPPFRTQGQPLMSGDLIQENKESILRWEVSVWS